MYIIVRVANIHPKNVRIEMSKLGEENIYGLFAVAEIHDESIFAE